MVAPRREPLEPLAPAPADAVAALVNDFATATRAAASEQEEPYPDLDPRLRALVPAAPGVDELVAVADTLWGIVAAPSRSEQSDRLNTVLRTAGLTPQVADTGRLAWLSPAQPPQRRLVASCAVSLLDFVRDHGWTRLNTCSADDCVDVFLDVVGRGTRRYCSDVCLNRSRLRAYRARQRR